MASRSRWRGRILCANAGRAAALVTVMCHLPVAAGEAVGEHLAEQAEEFLLVRRRQVLPTGFARRRRRLQARGGAIVGRSDMVQVLRACGTSRRSGPVRARPTGTQLRRLLYPDRQRVRREAVFVGSVFSDGTGSSPLTFTTGSIPANLTIPAFTVRQQPGPGSDADQDMIFHERPRAAPNTTPLLATDLAGQVMWYYDLTGSGFTLTKAGRSLVPGGTLLLNGVDRYTPVPTAPNVLREIDLAGNPVRETNLAALNAQLAAIGHEAIHAFHHDAQRLSDGTTVALALTERTIDVNGTPTNYVGEMVLVLDADFQVKWAWDAFDHLDVHRGPVLGEVVVQGSPEPTAVVPALPAV